MARIPRSLSSRPGRAEPAGATPRNPEATDPPRRRRITTAGAVGIITALGTLLAGLAALLALWLPTGGNASGGAAVDGTTGTGGSGTTDGVADEGSIHDLDSMVQLVLDTGTTELPGGAAYGEYADHSAEGMLEDELLTLGVQAPEAWDDVEVGNWLADDSDEIQGGFIAAGTDIDRLFDDWDTAGLFFAASPHPLEPAEVLDARNMNRTANCSGGANHRLSDGSLDGAFRIWTRCGGDGVTVDLAVNDRRSAGSMLLTFKAAGQQDLAAFHTAVDTLGFTVSAEDRDSQAPGFIIP